MINKSIIKRTDFQKLELFQQAKQQLQKLEELKKKVRLMSQNQDKSKSELFIKEQAIKLIEIYERIMDFYPVSQRHKQTKSSDQLSHRRQHSRFDKSAIVGINKTNEIKRIIITSTLSCNIAYVQTNFIGSIEEASSSLFKTRDQLFNFINKISKEQGRSQSSRHKSIFNKKNKNRNQRLKTSQQISQPSQLSLSNVFRNIGTNIHNKNIAENASIDAQLYLVFIRVSINLLISLISQNKINDATEVFKQMTDLIESISFNDVKARMIEFIFHSWFGITKNGFNKWREQVKKARNDKHFATAQLLSVEQAICLSHFIFNSDLFWMSDQQQPQTVYPEHFVHILDKSIEVFIQHQLYELAFFTLRHLLQSPIEAPLKEKYFMLLKELLQSGNLKQDIQLQNVESVQFFRDIIQTLNELYEKHQTTTKLNIQSQIDIQSTTRLFQLIIKIQIAQISSHNQIKPNQKAIILSHLNTIKCQTNYQIIQAMLSQKVAKNVISSISSKIQSLSILTRNKLKDILSLFITNLPLCQIHIQKTQQLTEKSLNIQTQRQKKIQKAHKMVSPSHSRKYLKIISTSIFTESSSIHPKTQQKHKFLDSTLSLYSNDQKKLSKMIRFCQYGAFLNKRNFNSDGGQFKFIKLTNDKIKWCKDPQKIDQSSQSYPLKDIKGISYGKIAPNWKKQCNKGLKQELCFSLILQKRTMDFYCKDYKQVENWVCGTSMILKRKNPQIAGYTPGKMRWRKMFATLREAFIQPLKIHQRNEYFYENAYSLILFKKNGYKLPSKALRV